MAVIGEITVAEYVLAIEGLAMARSLFVSPTDHRARFGEVEMIMATSGSDLLSSRLGVNQYEVADGYERWAPRYDGPNPAIETEEPIVRSIVETLTPGVALDAACGTGRHSALLTELG